MSTMDSCDVCNKPLKAHWRPDRDDSVYYTFCGHLVCRQCIVDFDTTYIVGCGSDGCRMCCLLALAKIQLRLQMRKANSNTTPPSNQVFTPQ